MFRFAGIGLVGLLALAVWIYCIFDVIASDEVLVRNLPKIAWLMIVLFFSTIGSIAWLALGRPLYAGWRPGDTGSRTSKRVMGPEDRDDFASRPAPRPDDEKRLQAWEADLRRREEDLRRREDGPPPQA